MHLSRSAEGSDDKLPSEQLKLTGWPECWGTTNWSPIQPALSTSRDDVTFRQRLRSGLQQRRVRGKLALGAVQL